MPTSVEVLFTPAEFLALATRDLTQTTCVVFDVLRATSTIVTALANDAKQIIPVSEIADALAIRHAQPHVLLAGERDGGRIRAKLTGGTDFDLGNSPREFTAEKIAGKTIALSTTNGSRALRACAKAHTVLVGSFLNLAATAHYLKRNLTPRLLLVCSGTQDEAAYEDILGAGALADLIQASISDIRMADSATVAYQIYQKNAADLLAAMSFSRNGRRLLSVPDLCDDVLWCLQRDIYSLVALLKNDALIKAAT